MRSTMTGMACVEANASIERSSMLNTGAGARANRCEEQHEQWQASKARVQESDAPDVVQHPQHRGSQRNEGDGAD